MFEPWLCYRKTCSPFCFCLRTLFASQSLGVWSELKALDFKDRNDVTVMTLFFLINWRQARKWRFSDAIFNLAISHRVSIFSQACSKFEKHEKLFTINTSIEEKCQQKLQIAWLETLPNLQNFTRKWNQNTPIKFNSVQAEAFCCFSHVFNRYASL